MMRAYELMIIIDGSLDDVVAQQWIANVSKGIADAGGNVHGKVDFWGKRRLAYPINKKKMATTPFSTLSLPAAHLTNSSDQCVSPTMSFATS